MKCHIWVALVAAGTLGACARPTPEMQVINDAAEALGGRDRILAVKTLIIEGEGSNANLGQDMSPDADRQRFTVTNYRRLIDVPGGRSRVEQVRTPAFVYFAGQAPQKQVLGVDGDVGYNVAADGTATRVVDQAARDRLKEVYHHPLTAVRAALDPAAKLANPRTQDNQSAVEVTTANGVTFTLAIDAGTKLPTRVVSMAYNTNLGDVAIETAFPDYQDVDGVQVPTRLTMKTDRYPTAELRLSRTTIDEDVGDLAAPQQARATAAMSGPPPATVSVEEVARGIWLLAGQSHHSVLAEFSDHLVVIEAPQNETRTLAVIARARELRPDKPLTHVINTHHHFDHSGGIRAAVSEGLTVVTHKLNQPFYEDIVNRQHSIVPDALSKNPKLLKIETVDSQLVLKDNMMTIELYPIEDGPHADTLLMAYFPTQRLLVQADTFSPGAAVSPFAANLLENVRKRNLRVDRVVPIHGKVVPFSELVKVAARATTN